jgi:type I restriction enzyme S subunit
MELKPGYKQTEVGVIPEDWDVKRLVAVCQKIQDGTHFSPKLGGSDFMYITSRNIRSGFLDLSVVETISKEEHAKIYQRCNVKRGDLLLTKDGANTGNVALNTIDEEFSLLSSVAMLRFDERNYAARYFMFQILSDFGQRQVKDAMSGNAITRLTLQKIKVLRFPVPPLPEQKAIAQALSDMDALISGLDDLIAKKRDIKQATMQQLLTGKTRLPGFTGEWDVKRLGDVVSLRKERADAKRLGCHDFCLELEHFGSGTGHLLGHTTTGHSATKSMFFEGDVLFGRLRAYLRKYWLATRTGVCSTEVWVLFSNPDAIRASFLFHVVQTDPFIDIAGTTYGTHMPRSDWNVVKNFELRLPSLPEQQAIAKVLTDMDAELEALDQRRDKTRELKQAMMQELLTGRTRLV